MEAGAAFRHRRGAFECEFWGDLIAEEMIEIAQDYSTPLVTAERRIEAIKQLLAALAPQKFGEPHGYREQSHGEGPVSFERTPSAARAAASRRSPTESSPETLQPETKAPRALAM